MRKRCSCLVVLDDDDETIGESLEGLVDDSGLVVLLLLLLSLLPVLNKMLYELCNYPSCLFIKQ